MKLFYHRDWRGNFGDDLNPPFFAELLPGYESIKTTKTLYGIGTLLNSVHGEISNTIVFGSGFGYGDEVKVDDSTVTFYGVRGPLTAERVRLTPSSEYVLGDPAIYVPRMHSFRGGEDLGKGRIVVALHHRSCEMWKLDHMASTDFCYLDPNVSLTNYISTIENSDLIITESLHGAIIAAAFGIPFIPVSFRTQVDPTKWADFWQLMEVPHAYHITCSMPKDKFLRRIEIAIARRLPFQLGRKLFTNGNKLSNDSIALIENDLKRIINESVTINIDPNVISKLQDRIEKAREKFLKDFNLI